jgi:glycine C-acetyltransferase
MIDDAHAAGFLGKTGRGTHEYCGVMDKIDIITGTLAKSSARQRGAPAAARRLSIFYDNARDRNFFKHDATSCRCFVESD